MDMEPLNEQQQLGSLMSSIESLRYEVRQMNDRLTDLESSVTDKFRTAETVLKIFKFLGLAIGAVLTFKFGDVHRLWIHFFG